MDARTAIARRSRAIAQARIAESAWEHELQACFGRAACNARYQPRGKGERGTLLAALHAFHAAANAEMHDAFAAARGLDTYTGVAA